jgi:hypothetical protein
VNTLAEALNEASSIANVPGLLKQIIGNDMWRKRYCKQTKKDVEFRRFTDFVTAHPPEGLGTNMQVLMSICRHSGDMEAVDALAQIEAMAPGGDRRSDSFKVGITNLEKNDTGYAMRRLAKDTPELHAQVLAGELSPNAAAIEAGFRKRKFQLPDDAIAAGRYLAGRVDKEWLLAMVDEFMKRIEA